MKKIKKGDTVQVMRGKDSGKTGEVLQVKSVLDKRGKARTLVVIKDVNVVKRNQKPIPQLGIEGGIIEKEMPVDISNIMYVEPKSGKPTRIGFKIDKKTGKKFRVIKKTGEIIN